MRITLSALQKMHDTGEKIAVLTCYDASFAGLLESNGVEVLLVGDSLGMVVQGRESTLPVTIDQIAYHVACVTSGAQRAFIVADMPFGTSQFSARETFAYAVQLMQAGAHMVKLEGGAEMADTVKFLTSRGIPVCAHIGLTPQSVNQLGGYRVQGRELKDAKRLQEDALALARAGAGMIVLEAMPAKLGAEITKTINIPTIGIGAGPDCSGQVLVVYDMLGIYQGKKPRFVKNFMQGAKSVGDAVARYVKEVKAGTFPDEGHSF